MYGVKIMSRINAERIKSAINAFNESVGDNYSYRAGYYECIVEALLQQAKPAARELVIDQLLKSSNSK